MNQPIPFQTEAPDYQAAYLRLVDKIYRTGLFYQKARDNWRAKFNATGDPTAEALANSLDRAVNDMQFIFQRAVFILPCDVVTSLKDAAQERMAS